MRIVGENMRDIFDDPSADQTGKAPFATEEPPSWENLAAELADWLVINQSSAVVIAIDACFSISYAHQYIYEGSFAATTGGSSCCEGELMETTRTSRWTSRTA